MAAEYPPTIRNAPMKVTVVETYPLQDTTSLVAVLATVDEVVLNPDWVSEDAMYVDKALAWTHSLSRCAGE